MTRILVVDDDAEITKLLEKFLSNEGYQVTIASNGAAALSAASAAEPELVLLDIVIGVEDGREVLRDLRLISDVPVIFLTGRGLETERIAGLKLGADDSRGSVRAEWAGTDLPRRGPPVAPGRPVLGGAAPPFGCAAVRRLL